MLRRQLREGGDAQGKLIATAGWDVVARTTATVLAVYKPGRRMSRDSTATMSSRPQSSPLREEIARPFQRLEATCIPEEAGVTHFASRLRRTGRH